MKHAQFRFYEELNDFLPPAKRKVPFQYEFMGKPSVKDAIEAPEKNTAYPRRPPEKAGKTPPALRL